MNKLLILCGIPFSGKTTLAKQLAERANFIRVDLDDIKFELLGSNIIDDDIDQAGWDKIYQEMYRQIENYLLSGKTVVQDTGNFTKYERSLVQAIAEKLNIPTVTVFVNTPYKIAKERLIENRKTKERFDVNDQNFEAAVAEMEVPTIEENVIELIPGKSLDYVLEQISE